MNKIKGLTLALVPTVSLSPSARFFRPARRLVLALASFAILPTNRAVSSPRNEGYPNGNIAQEADTLFNLTIDVTNTAKVFEVLLNHKLV